jgi:phospholipid transport system substrate-binding protein
MKHFAILISFAAALAVATAVSQRVQSQEAGAGAAEAAATPKPLSEVETTINQLVEVVQEFPGADQKVQRRQAMLKVIQPRFDFKEMSMRSLGDKWPTLTPEQQKEFVDAFSDLLAKTYLNRLERIEPGMVSYKGEKTRGNKAQVKTTVSYENDVFPLDYRLVYSDGQWKVYDVIIENIGLVQNYRHEFAGIIRKEKFDGLMRRLREKGKE